MRPLKEQYRTRKFDGKIYHFYTSRIYKHSANVDKRALQSRGEKARIVKLQGRWIVFRRS